MAVNASESSPTAGKAAPRRSASVRRNCQQRCACWFRPEYTVTDPDQRGLLQGEASLTVNTQRLDNQRTARCTVLQT